MGFGDIGGGIGGLIGGIIGLGSTSDDGKKYSEEALNVFRKLQMPNFDMRQLNPHELQVVGEYMPEVYEFIAPQGPQTVSTGPEGRNAQQDALSYYQQYAQEGVPMQDRLAAEEATNALSRQAQRDQDFAVQSMQRRGMARGGDELAARAAMGQQSADLARGMGQDLSRNALLSRLQAASQGAQLGGQMRAQDMDQSAMNANIWNRFNEFVSQGMTEAARSAAQTRNLGQMANLGEQQRVSDYNTENRNAYQMYNQQNPNQLRQQMYNNELSRAGGLANAAGAAGNRADAADAAMVNTMGSLGRAGGSVFGGIADIYDSKNKKKTTGGMS